MKTLGLLGGMSAESTAIYYRELNRLVRERLGGLHSADLLLWSVDFAPIAALQAKGDWDETGRILADGARRLEQAGAQAIVLCTNTMHLNAPAIAGAVSVPFLHIGDATAAALKARGVQRPLLLATRFTMEQGFYKDELCQGVVNPASKAEVLAMVAKGRASGADGVIFGCTEVGLLLSQDDLDVPAIDTTLVHCEAAVGFALG